MPPHDAKSAATRLTVPVPAADPVPVLQRLAVAALAILLVGCGTTTTPTPFARQRQRRPARPATRRSPDDAPADAPTEPPAVPATPVPTPGHEVYGFVPYWEMDAYDRAAHVAGPTSRRWPCSRSRIDRTGRSTRARTATADQRARSGGS